MKKIRIAKGVWVLSIFLGLIVILIAVMNYKIYFQYKTKNRMYFYDCNGTLCVTEVSNNEHLLYSKYECGYEECPIFKSEINDTYVVLENNLIKTLYNYRNGKIVSSDYDDYFLLNDKYLIVLKDKKYGIIDLNNKITVSIDYQQLGYISDGYLMGYNLNYIIAKKAGKYGIISIKNGAVKEDFNYDESKLPDLIAILNDVE